MLTTNLAAATRPAMPRPAAPPAAAPRRGDPSRLWRAIGLPAQRAAAPSPVYEPGQCRCFRDLAGLFVGAEECALALCVDDRPQSAGVRGDGAEADVGGDGRLGRLVEILDGMVAGSRTEEQGQVTRLLDFLGAIDRAVPEELDVHLIVDRRASCRALEVREWLMLRRRFHLHFASDHGRWLARARAWVDFAERRQQAWRAPRGTLALERAIEAHLARGVGGGFQWTRSADETLTNLARFVVRRGAR